MRERENEHCKCVAFHWILLLYATMFLKLYTSAPYTVHRQCILYIWWNFALLSRFSEAKKNSHMTLQRRTKQTFGSDKFCTRTFFVLSRQQILLCFIFRTVSSVPIPMSVFSLALFILTFDLNLVLVLVLSFTDKTSCPKAFILTMWFIHLDISREWARVYCACMSANSNIVEFEFDL